MKLRFGFRSHKNRGDAPLPAEANAEANQAVATGKPDAQEAPRAVNSTDDNASRNINHENMKVTEDILCPDLDSIDDNDYLRLVSALAVTENEDSSEPERVQEMDLLLGTVPNAPTNYNEVEAEEMVRALASSSASLRLDAVDLEGDELSDSGYRDNKSLEDDEENLLEILQRMELEMEKEVTERRIRELELLLQESISEDTDEVLTSHALAKKQPTIAGDDSTVNMYDDDFHASFASMLSTGSHKASVPDSPVRLSRSKHVSASAWTQRNVLRSTARGAAVKRGVSLAQPITMATQRKQLPRLDER